MTQYFDKDFFKFLISFVAIIFISLVIVSALKEYQMESKVKSTMPESNIAVPRT